MSKRIHDTIYNASNFSELDKLLTKYIHQLVIQLNNCIQRKYVDIYVGVEFIPCCQQDEINLIKECYYLYKKYNIDSKDITIDMDALKAIIVFYYSVQVLEVYDLNPHYNPCIEQFYKYKNGNTTLSKDIVETITTSEDKNISEIRRKLLRMPIVSEIRNSSKRNSSPRNSSPKRSSPKSNSSKRSSPKRSSPKRSSPKRSSPKTRKHAFTYIKDFINKMF